MEIIQLNEEIKVRHDGLELIMLIDYNHKSIDIFKHYEDKTFSSSDVVKYRHILNEASDIADKKLHPERYKKEPMPFEEREVKPTKCRVKVKPEILKAWKTEGKDHRTYDAKVCTQCGKEYIPNGPRQSYCKKCRP